MAGRDDFTPDEWLTMRRAMLGAPVFVSMSDGGRADMMREMLAVSARVLAARRRHNSQLVRELATIRRFHPGFRSGIPLAELEGLVLEAIRSATAAVAAKAPAEAQAFREFVVVLVEAAARANREGGFLGLGGVDVSYTEAVAIAKVKDALGLRERRDPAGGGDDLW